MEALGQKALDFALSFQPEPTDGKAAPAARARFPRRGEEARAQSRHHRFLRAADTPPAGLPPSPAFNNAAFALSKDDPVSSVVALSDGVAVIHLVEVQPSELRPLGEVQAAISASLQAQKGAATAQAQAGRRGEGTAGRRRPRGRGGQARPDRPVRRRARSGQGAAGRRAPAGHCLHGGEPRPGPGVRPGAGAQRQHGAGDQAHRARPRPIPRTSPASRRIFAASWRTRPAAWWRRIGPTGWSIAPTPTGHRTSSRTARRIKAAEQSPSS